MENVDYHPTLITHVYDEDDELTSSVEEFASLDSYEVNTNAKGELQFHMKLYSMPGEDRTKELISKLSSLKDFARIQGHKIAGEGS
jgi:hypothetical protein